MHTATDLLKEPVSQAKAAAIARPKTARLAYLDTLRVILIVLVIALHTAITYGASGGWPFTDPGSTELSGILLTMVTGMVQAFSLGLYFFISGYFTPGSYDRKGILRFWKYRLLRLGIPLVLYTWVLSLVPGYFAALGNGEEPGTFWAFFGRRFLNYVNEGPTWFIFALLMFLAGYTLWRLATPGKISWASRLNPPNKKQILGFGLLVAVLMFVVGIWSPVNNSVELLGIFSFMIVFGVQYILFFIAGLLAYRNDWLGRWDAKDLRFWSWLSLGLGLMLPVVFGIGMAMGSTGEEFMGGVTWQAAVFMLWVGLFSVSISMMLILWLRGKQQSPMMAFAGPNSYAVYLIHPLILVPLSVAFVAVPLDPLLKYVIVLPIVVVLCFLVSAALRRIPGVKAIL